MLKHTLVLPETDSVLAVEMLEDAVESLDIVLMLLIGKGSEASRIVRWADKLCNKTQTEDGNLRKVVWIRDTSSRRMQDALAVLLGAGALPKVAVLNFHDEMKATLGEGDKITPLTLERAFAMGHQL